MRILNALKLSFVENSWSMCLMSLELLSNVCMISTKVELWKACVLAHHKLELSSSYETVFRLFRNLNIKSNMLLQNSPTATLEETPCLKAGLGATNVFAGVGRTREGVYNLARSRSFLSSLRLLRFLYLQKNKTRYPWTRDFVVSKSILQPLDDC